MLGILIPFATIFMAEFGDKTQLYLIMLAASYSHCPLKIKTKIFFGAMLAFLIVDGVAVIAGSAVASVGVIPQSYIKIAAGVLFILLGLTMLKEFFSKNECAESSEKLEASQKSSQPKSVFWAAFGAILLTEWGDKTQIASGMFAAKFNGFMVIAGAIAALGILSAMAIWVGGALAKKINPRIVHAAGGAIFIATGVATIIFNN